MPSVVCEPSANVNAALLESLGDSGALTANNEASAADDGSSNSDGIDCLHSKLAASAKRVLQQKVEYEEVSNYNQSVLETLKSKYVVLKPTENETLTNAENGRNFTTAATCKSVSQDAGAGSAADAGAGIDIIGAATAATATNPTIITHATGTGSSNSTTLMKRQQPYELPQPKRTLYPRENIRPGWQNCLRHMHVGVGFMNVGNTCYLNATLQALFHIPSMVTWLLSDSDHMAQCNVPDSGCIICSMSKTLQATQNSNSAIRPLYVYSKLKMICKHLSVGRQEDAHEFLRYLVEAMEKAYLARFRFHKELDQYSKETTPLNQILGGYLRTTVRCLSCFHVSVTFQHFQDLLLDIRKAENIEEALDGYFCRERLEDMSYKCEACKKKVAATKQFALERAPIVLCIQLKRFSVIGNKLTKIVHLKQRLDLTRFMNRKTHTEPLTYRLVSLVTHLGASQHCGHYTAIGMHEGGTYYLYDDCFVRPVPSHSVGNTNAYIIFYELERTPQRTVSNTVVSGFLDSKENYQKANGYGNNYENSNNAQRIIGPLLPNGNATANANKSHLLKEYEHRNGNILVANRQHAASSNSSNGVNANNKISIRFKNNYAKSPATYTIATSTSNMSVVSSMNNGSVGGLNKSAENRATYVQQQQKNLKLTKSKAADELPVKERNGTVVAVTAGGNNNANFSESDNEVSSSTGTNNLQPSLPCMPSLNEVHETVSSSSVTKANDNSNEQKNMSTQSTSKPIILPTAQCKLVPYAYGTDDEELAETEAKRIKCNNSNDKAVNHNSNGNANNSHTNGHAAARKRRNSNSNGSYSNSSSDEDTNKPKVRKQSKATINGINGKRSKSKSPNTCIDSQSIDNIFKKRNDKLVTEHIVSSMNVNQEPKSLIETNVNNNDQTDLPENLLEQTTLNQEFRRSKSTPPITPLISSPTGKWQVSSLQTLQDNVSATKAHKNPFAASKMMPQSSSINDKKREREKLKTDMTNGNGYAHNAANAVTDLLTTHQGYGDRVLSWNGDQNHIDQEPSLNGRAETIAEVVEKDDFIQNEIKNTKKDDVEKIQNAVQNFKEEMDQNTKDKVVKNIQAEVVVQSIQDNVLHIIKKDVVEQILSDIQDEIVQKIEDNLLGNVNEDVVTITKNQVIQQNIEDDDDVIEKTKDDQEH